MKGLFRKTVILSLAAIVLVAALTVADQIASHRSFFINPYGHIHVRSAAAVEKTRRSIIDFIWKQDGLPVGRLPDLVESGVHEPFFANLPSLARADRLTIRQPNGIDSIGYLLVPRGASDVLIVYHEGHGPLTAGLDTLRFFLDAGFPVLAFTMPFEGENPRPLFTTARGERVRLWHHVDFKLIDTPSRSALRYFLDPVYIGLNYAQRQHHYRAIDMVGVSGGGWTTTLYAAIDRRVRWSFPVAGSLPLYLMTAAEGHEFEQVHRIFLSVASYLDVYILGGYGEGRGQVQILNRYDPCCFWGRRYLNYEWAIKRVMSDLGEGHFEVFSDASHRKHMISPRALALILKTIRKQLALEE